jgi:hypothetical protein
LANAQCRTDPNSEKIGELPCKFVGCPNHCLQLCSCF